ncbi:MAG: ArsR/SmtB family transcription factor [Limnochordia bacterium]|jgi:ArsR family transcriptional regulator
MDNDIPILKALADDTRYRLLKLLLSHDFCVGALARKLGISKSAVSQHLKVLREAGLVKGEKRGYYTHYSVERNLLRETAEKLTLLSELRGQKGGCADHLKDGLGCRCPGKSREPSAQGPDISRN